MGEFKNYLEGEYQQYGKHQKDLFIVLFNKIYLVPNGIHCITFLR